MAGSLLIQHGSYQWISCEDQPRIEQGEVLLYRGIGQSSVFRCLQFEPSDLNAANRDIWRKYLGVQAEMLSDSVLSFNTIHDRVKRSERLRAAPWNVAGRHYGNAGWTRHRVAGQRPKTFGTPPSRDILWIR
jgi:hypothetical protein